MVGRVCRGGLWVFDIVFFFFFFQAEDGIRDVAVTGVQTCALPICVESELMSYAPGAATSPTTYTRTVRSLCSDTSAEISRNCVRKTRWMSCCTSPRDRKSVV